MREYTANVRWLEVNKGRHSLKSLWIRDIKARSIVEASEVALSHVKDKICPSVSCIWFNWP